MDGLVQESTRAVANPEPTTWVFDVTEGCGKRVRVYPMGTEVADVLV